MRKYLACLIVLVLFVGCKKDESYEYYYQKAEEKRIEIENLIKTFACGDLSNWKVDELPSSGIGSLYFPIMTSPTPEYMRLKTEYEALIKKAKKLDDRIIYYDYLPNPAIAIECVDGYPKVMTAYDYNLEKATIVLNNKITEIEALTANTTCTGTEEWHILQLIKDCKSAYISINKNDKTLMAKTNEFQLITWALQRRIVSLDHTKNSCFRYEDDNRSFEVSCENNKPVVTVK